MCLSPIAVSAEEGIVVEYLWAAETVLGVAVKLWNMVGIGVNGPLIATCLDVEINQTSEDRRA